MNKISTFGFHFEVMKLFYVLFTICIIGIGALNAQFIDNFSDGNFNLNPTWIGDTSNYTVNSSFLFQLNAPAVSGTMYASTPSVSINNATWNFYVQFNFNPSSTNFAKVYLVSDQSNLKNPLNGYFVKIGNTADEVSLYRQTGTTETMIIDGVNGRLNTTQITVSIQVTRDNLGNWQLFSDTLGGTIFFLEGSVFDNNHVTSAFFGVVSTYTATRSTLFFYDNFNVFGQGFIDNTPPTIDSVVVLNMNNLDVHFNEPVNIVSAQTLSNYSVNLGIGIPSSSLRDAIDSSLVHLTFTNTFVANQNYNLTTTNVNDTANNAITSIITPFVYPLIIIPNKGDVVINEILADPTPQVGLPTEEFVELFNASSSTFNLNNWKFINTTTVKNLPSFVLHPNSYVILCDVNDTALFLPFGSVIGIASFSALTNSADSLTLTDNNNTILDIVAYKDSWYRDNNKKDGGYTLELINPFNPCSNSNNWGASLNINGGSPGVQNSVFDATPDAVLPKISSLNILSLTQIEVIFSETMDSSSLFNSSIAINNNITITNVNIPSFPLKLVLTHLPALDSSLVYSLTISNGTDCAGNMLSPSTFSFGIGKAPEKFEIIITELFADPEPSNGLPLADYLELFNPTNKIIDLTGCILSDLTSSDVLNAGKILPGEYIIVCDNSFESQFSPFGKVISVNSMPSLNNTEDEITLQSPTNTFVHAVHYFDDWYNDVNKTDGGWSFEMIDPANPCGEEDNWAASTSFFGGTPGVQNSIFSSNPDNMLPILTEANATSDSTVILTFSEIIDFDALLNANYMINNNINVASVSIINNKNVLLSLNNKLAFQINYEVSISGIFDCVGNNIGTNNTTFFALPEQGFSGNLIINEILFNPFTGGADFVEIYNNSNKFINLQNWHLANVENDTISNKRVVITKPRLILPREFVVFTTNTANVALEYLNAKINTFIQMSTLPAYNDREGTVVLLNNLNMNVDSFSYNSAMHFSLLNDLNGVSLERIDYNRLTNDKTNWHSAAENVGFATPGFENSQFQQVTIDDEIKITPTTFSPNNDGVEDLLTISYNFLTAGFVANVMIYDAKGREVRNLIKNELLGSRGSFSWDGINNDNEKARIGIYVIYIEIYKLDGTTKSFKKTAVLAGRFD